MSYIFSGRNFKLRNCKGNIYLTFFFLSGKEEFWEEESKNIPQVNLH